MFLQNLRAKVGARLNGDGEAGFTLIELLVVMLILGILAAIAIPAFFNQRDKGTDAQAKSAVRTAETAMETYATENGGKYTNATPAILKEIEPTLQTAGNNKIEVPAAGESTFTVQSVSGTGNTFIIKREAGGVVDFDCTVGAAGKKGGCPSNGNWNE
jgi:type IV pilus assembly protein PilA